jgi:hypothetical protein
VITVIDVENVRDEKRQGTNERKKMRSQDEKKWKQDGDCRKTRMGIPGLD